MQKGYKPRTSIVREKKSNLVGETYSRVQVGKHLSNMFPIKNDLKRRNVLTSLLLKFAVEYAIRRFQINQVGLKLNGTHQFLVYADGLGGSNHTIQKSTEALD